MNGIYKVSRGEGHSLFIKDGNLYGWGSNPDGRLGVNNAQAYEKAPVLISNSGNWTDISAGLDHSLGICGGYLYSWGNNSHGQLGLTYCDQEYTTYPAFSGLGHEDFGKQESKETRPQKVGGLNGWTKVSAGNQYSLGIRNGYLYGWGKNYAPWNVVGIEMYNLDTTLYLPRQFIITIPIRVSTHNNWTDISAGSKHTLGVQGGKLRSCGAGTKGILGDNDDESFHPGRTNYYKFSENTQLTLSEFSDAGIFAALSEASDADRPYPLPTNTTWTNVSAGALHSLGISGGDLYSWGSNINGALGDGTKNDCFIPKLIDNTNNWYKVDAGDNFSLGLIDTGAGYYEPRAWGTNYNCQLGNGTKNDSLIPIPFDIQTYSDISAGGNNSAGIESYTGNNNLLTWGFDLSSPFTLGNSRIDPNLKIPNQYKVPNSFVGKITAGWNNMFVLNKNGSFEHIWFKGLDPINPAVLSSYYNNEFNQPQKIKDIAAGLDTFIVSRSDNSIGVAGLSIDLDNISHRLWKKINRRDVISGVYCGVVNYGVVFEDGTAETWGRYKKVAIQQPITVDWKQIAAGSKHIVILTNYDEIYCFGDNTHRQCTVPAGLSNIKSVFATDTASGVVKTNGDIVYWGFVDEAAGSQLDIYKYSVVNPDATLKLPLNRKYKHNLIGYTFDGLGETLYKDTIKNKLNNYYNQLGSYPEKIVLNIAEGYNNELRWFTEPAKFKYLGFTLNVSGISKANDGVTYQNIWNSNYNTAPTTDEDFSLVLNTITDFYNHGYTLAKQAIYEITGNRDSVAVGFNTGSLLPNYTWVGFTATNSGFTTNSKISWINGNTLVNYLEFNKDSSWRPYVTQGPNSYLPVSGFDTSKLPVKNYSGITADKKYYINSIGITSAVYSTYYKRWKEFLNNVDFDFVLDSNISNFILPEDIKNTSVIWSKTKQILTDYETEYSKKLNKNLYVNYTHVPNNNIGTTLGVVLHGPILTAGATGISINKQIVSNSTQASKSVGYNSAVDSNNIIENAVLAVSGSSAEREAMDQWYYYGVYGGTYAWNNYLLDVGHTPIDWSVLQSELVNEDYTVFTSGKPNITKYTSTINYLTNLNSAYKNQFDFYNLTNISKVKSGKDHSILLDKFGTIYFLGSTFDNRQNIINDKTYIDISAGESHSTAIDQQGSLYTAGKILIDSGACSGSTVSVELQTIPGTFDTVESGFNHIALFETGQNKEYLGRVDSVDDAFKRIYVKNYSASDETQISFDDPSGTEISIIRDGVLVKTIQHKFLSIDSYMNTVQYMVDSNNNILDPVANNGAAWKMYFIDFYKNANNYDYLLTPIKVQNSTLVTDAKYLSDDKLYQFERKFKELVNVENKIDINIKDL